MGMVMGHYDILVRSFFAKMNLRFGPSVAEPDWLGGIEELAGLQREFEVFHEGRPFARSIALLGTGSLTNPQANSRWFQYMEGVAKFASNLPNENGDTAIVKTMIANLRTEKPLPVHFTNHLAQDPITREPRWMVIVRMPDRPLVFTNQEYITVSFPVKPRPLPAAKRATRPRTRRPK
jgi:hypothetical protein